MIDDGHCRLHVSANTVPFAQYVGGEVIRSYQTSVPCVLSAVKANSNRSKRHITLVSYLGSHFLLADLPDWRSVTTT
jgi:hypothetical protein